MQVRVRTEQQTPDWKARYAVRSGVEGTINQFAHGHGMRRCRYRGQPKVHLQHVLTAIAVNIERLSSLLPTGECPAPRPPFRASWTSRGFPGRSPGEPSAADLDNPKIPDRVKLSSCCVSDLERCPSNESLHRVIAVGARHGTGMGTEPLGSSEDAYTERTVQRPCCRSCALRPPVGPGRRVGHGRDRLPVGHGGRRRRVRRTGFDGGKLINGLKQHVAVNALGLLPAEMATTADIVDRPAATVLPARTSDAHHRLELVRADGRYSGSLIEYCFPRSRPADMPSHPSGGAPATSRWHLDSPHARRVSNESPTCPDVLGTARG
ncbi:transposase [Streptomyces sp. NPDC002520]